MVLVRINLEVPMAYMVLQICDKTRKSDFSTHILCGTVVALAFLYCMFVMKHTLLFVAQKALNLQEINNKPLNVH